MEEDKKQLCPANDMTCPYWRWGGLCTLETAKDDCDEFYFWGEEDEEDEGTDRETDEDE